MRKLLVLTLATLVISGGATRIVSAQSADTPCYKKVLELCGDKSVGNCFADNAKWGEVGSECEGEVQQLIEGENDAAQANQINPVGLKGTSYGGILRKGPSQDSGKKASMKLGDKIEILEDTGVWMDSYKWFKVKTARGIGYQWGGIFCIPGDTLPEGVFDNCQLLKSQ